MSHPRRLACSVIPLLEAKTSQLLIYFSLGTEDRYNYTTVKENELNGWVLQGLQSFTKYKVIVQAFNNVGSGPASAGVIAVTAEAGQD